MDIVVTSGTQDPCNFVSNFADAININEGYEIAVKSVFHAPAFNITEKNNEFSIAVARGEQEAHPYFYSIPVGFYENTCDVLMAIHKLIAGIIETDIHPGDDPDDGWALKQPLEWVTKFQTTGDAVSLIMGNKKSRESRQHFAIGVGTRDSLFRVLGYCASEITLLDRIDTPQRVFENCLIAGFMYSNIVTNLTIDQQQSRLLACFPVESNPGYNYYEFQNPSFRPLSVHAFTDLTFVLTDVDGKFLRMDSKNKYFTPTVLHLHIRKI